MLKTNFSLMSSPKTVSNNYLDRFGLGISLIVFTILVGTVANAWNAAVQRLIERKVVEDERNKGKPVLALPSNETLFRIEDASFSFVISLTIVIFILIVIFAMYSYRNSILNRLIS